MCVGGTKKYKINKLLNLSVRSVISVILLNMVVTSRRLFKGTIVVVKGGGVNIIYECS